MTEEDEARLWQLCYVAALTASGFAWETEGEDKYGNPDFTWTALDVAIRCHDLANAMVEERKGRDMRLYVVEPEAEPAL